MLKRQLAASISTHFIDVDDIDLAGSHEANTLAKDAMHIGTVNLVSRPETFRGSGFRDELWSLLLNLFAELVANCHKGPRAGCPKAHSSCTGLNQRGSHPARKPSPARTLVKLNT